MRRKLIREATNRSTTTPKELKERQSPKNHVDENVLKSGKTMGPIFGLNSKMFEHYPRNTIASWSMVEVALWKLWKWKTGLEFNQIGVRVQEKQCIIQSPCSVGGKRPSDFISVAVPPLCMWIQVHTVIDSVLYVDLDQLFKVNHEYCGQWYWKIITDFWHC